MNRTLLQTLGGRLRSAAVLVLLVIQRGLPAQPQYLDIFSIEPKIFYLSFCDKPMTNYSALKYI